MAQKHAEITSYGRKVKHHEETDICVNSLLSCSDEKRFQTWNCQQKSKRFRAFPVLLSQLITAYYYAGKITVI